MAACGEPEVADCPAGRELKDGFCVQINCGPGQRVVDGACLPITCAPGTTLEGDDCVSDDTTAPITNATPGGGTYSGSVSVVLTANEPAVVFYTTDGSTPSRSSMSGPSPVTVELAATAELRFFAVDAAGNEEIPLTENYTVDASGPGDVTALTAVLGPPDVDLAWTNPTDADFTGVIVARGRGLPLGWQPANGVDYEVGEQVAPGVVIVSKPTGEALTDTDPWGDLNGYAVWGVDSVLNYSATPATAEVVAFFPRQPIDVTADIEDVNITFGEQPPDVFVSVANAEVSPNRDRLDLGLKIKNLAARPIYNLKVVVRSVSTGAVAADGTYDGDDAIYLGPNAVPPGGTREGTVRVTGLPIGTTEVQFSLEIVTHPLVAGPASKYDGSNLWLNDSGAAFSGSASNATDSYPTSSGQRKKFQSMELSPDGLKLYGSNGNQAQIAVLDLVTLDATASADLGGPGMPPVAGIEMTLSPDGQFIYAALTTSIHWRRFNSTASQRGNGGQPIDTQLVKLDAATLAEVDRVDLMMDLPQSPGGRAVKPAVSADGTRVAVPIDGQGRLIYVNADTMSVIFNAVLSDLRPRAAAIAPGNGAVFVAYVQHELARVNTMNQVESPVNTGYTTGSNVPGSLTVGPDGNIYLARTRMATGLGGIVRINPMTLAFTNLFVNTEFTGMAFQNDRVAVGVRYNIDEIRLINVVQFNQLVAQPVPRFAQGHGAVMSKSPLWQP